MTSSRNAFSRRAYKERAQPESRKKFGLLEKHKDYVIRAKAYNRKKEALRRLRLKAEFRNPDEFYFKMINSRLVDGVHRSKSHANESTQRYEKPRFKVTKMKDHDGGYRLDRANKFTAQELSSLKKKDSSYVLQLLESEKKTVEKLSATLHSLGGLTGKKVKQIYYVEDRETESSHNQLEARKSRVRDLEKLYAEMSMEQPPLRPVYKRLAERKR